MHLEERLNEKLIKVFSSSEKISEDVWNCYEFLYKDSKSLNVHYASIYIHFDEKKGTYTIMLTNVKPEMKISENISLYRESSSKKGELFTYTKKVNVNEVMDAMKYQALTSVARIAKIKIEEPTEPEEEIEPNQIVDDGPIDDPIDPDEPAFEPTDPDEPMDDPIIVMKE